MFVNLVLHLQVFLVFTHKQKLNRYLHKVKHLKIIDNLKGINQ
jgi:hypothetical protein